MITKEQIEELGGWQAGNGYEYIFDSWEYLYNSKTQTFWNINDGFGEPELLVKKVKDYDHLIQIITALNLDI
jgi:hypothetical protein